MIRPATPADIPTLHDMLQRLSDHDGGNAPVGPATALHDALFAARPLLHALIAGGTAPQGMILYFPEFSTHRGQPGLHVQDLWIEAAARAQGLGRRLLSAALAAQDWGATYVTLQVTPANRDAVAFYTRLGFTFRGYQSIILSEPGLKALL